MDKEKMLRIRKDMKRRKPHFLRQDVNKRIRLAADGNGNFF